MEFFDLAVNRENRTMGRKIILNLAMSLDGFIADEEGGYDWIIGDGSHHLDTPQKWDFSGFLGDVDTVVMGKNCYEQGFHKDFAGKAVFVAASAERRSEKGITFISGDVAGRIAEEKAKQGKNIYLFGGGRLCDAFLKADIIDEYVIGIIPVILGKGIPLFLKDNPNIRLSLKGQFAEEGVVVLHYERRRLELL